MFFLNESCSIYKIIADSRPLYHMQTILYITMSSKVWRKGGHTAKLTVFQWRKESVEERHSVNTVKNRKVQTWKNNTWMKQKTAACPSWIPQTKFIDCLWWVWKEKASHLAIFSTCFWRWRFITKRYMEIEIQKSTTPKDTIHSSISSSAQG